MHLLLCTATYVVFLIIYLVLFSSILSFSCRVQQESDKEAEKLRDALMKEKASVSKLEKELEELRSCCSCCKHPSIDDSPPKEEPFSCFSATGSLMEPLVQESTKCTDMVHEYNQISMVRFIFIIQFIVINWFQVHCYH